MCEGGPLDGHIVTPAPGKYSWVTGQLEAWGADLGPLPGQRPRYSNGGAARSKPRDGAALYEFTSEGLVYAGHRAYLCDGCGCYHGKCEGGREKRPCALGGDS